MQLLHAFEGPTLARRREFTQAVAKVVSLAAGRRVGAAPDDRPREAAGVTVEDGR
jgi:hypothetical protein